MRIERNSQINLEQAIETIENAIDMPDVRTHRKLDCIETLSLFLCIEARKAEESVYWPWLRTLPTDFNTLLVKWGNRFDSLLPLYFRELKRGHEERGDSVFFCQSLLLSMLNRINNTALIK